MSNSLHELSNVKYKKSHWKQISSQWRLSLKNLQMRTGRVIDMFQSNRRAKGAQKFATGLAETRTVPQSVHLIKVRTIKWRPRLGI